jgi:nucleoside-diphosphate-sugar epimerase
MPVAAVTGASGFLGSHLCAILLQKGYSVRAFVKHADDIDRVVQYCSLYGVEYADNLHVVAGGDLTNVDTLVFLVSGADVVFHCAALVSFMKKHHNNLMESNWQGTENVVNACLRAGVKKLVHTSSVAALGREKGQEVADEKRVWTESSLNTSYAVSKHLAELAVWRGAEEGLSVSMVNPGIILGPCLSDTGTGLIFKRAKKGAVVYPAGSNGFVGVEDVARLMIAIFEADVWGHRFVAVSENLSYKDLLTMLAKTYKKPTPYIKISPGLARILARVLGFFEGLGLKTPWPAQGLISTSSVSHYQSINIALVPGFTFTPISEVIKSSVVFSP